MSHQFSSPVGPDGTDPSMVRNIARAIRQACNHTVMAIRKPIVSPIVVLWCGLLPWGCGSSAGSDRHESHDPSARPVSSQGRLAAVRLSGCVELSGTTSGGYVLQRVHIEVQKGQDPKRTSTYPPTEIAEGSWVRLTGARELAALTGRRVLVSGIIVDTGRNAVGTTSVSGVALSSGDVSPAAKRETDSTGSESITAGTAPEIKVTDIKDLGETCSQR